MKYVKIINVQLKEYIYLKYVPCKQFQFHKN